MRISSRPLLRSHVRFFSSSPSATSFPLAVIGTGPSAFYTAKYLLDADPRVRVDFFERLPTPFGLVRYGVAPDHPEVKSVISTFEEVVQKHSDRVRLFANVEIGEETSSSSCAGESVSTAGQAQQKLSLAALRRHYSAVVLAYGADSDRALRIPGSDLPGVLSAHQFVNWYNGHPDYAQLSVDLSEVRHVVIVGQGNVALDCARILAKDVDRELLPTDIASHAVQALRKSAVESVTVVGRRGHVQAAFTIKELRELTKIDGVAVRIDPQELAAGMTQSTVKELENNRPKKRIVELMEQIANQENNNSTNTNTNAQRRVDIRFLWSPTSLSASVESGRVGGITVTRTRLEGEAFHQRAVNTQEEQRWPCDLLLSSIGYKSSRISEDVPFDEDKNVVRNVRGRVTGEREGEEESPKTIPGMYVTGWLKRGPVGIIGANITDAKETAAAVVEDIHAQAIPAMERDPVESIAESDAVAGEVLRRAVTWEEAQRLHEHEIELGQRRSTPRLREKITSVPDMIRIAKLEEKQ